jgi:hypothetical protein
MPKFALVLAAVAAFAWMPRAAAANDTLHVVAGFAGGIEVLENVAKYGGLFAAEHLDVDKQYSNSAANCAQLAGSGKADVCATSIEPTILGYDKGLRLVIFFSRVATYEYLLAVPADSPIKTLAGFKGAEKWRRTTCCKAPGCANRTIPTIPSVPAHKPWPRSSRTRSPGSRTRPPRSAPKAPSRT